MGRVAADQLAAAPRRAQSDLPRPSARRSSTSAPAAPGLISGRKAFQRPMDEGIELLQRDPGRLPLRRGHDRLADVRLQRRLHARRVRDTYGRPCARARSLLVARRRRRPLAGGRRAAPATPTTGAADAARRGRPRRRRRHDHRRLDGGRRARALHRHRHPRVGRPSSRCSATGKPASAGERAPRRRPHACTLTTGRGARATATAACSPTSAASRTAVRERGARARRLRDDPRDPPERAICRGVPRRGAQGARRGTGTLGRVQALAAWRAAWLCTPSCGVDCCAMSMKMRQSLDEFEQAYSPSCMQTAAARMRRSSARSSANARASPTAPTATGPCGSSCWCWR